MSLLIAFIVLLASFPAGYILKSLTKEEMAQGNKYFRYTWIASLIIAVFFLFSSISDPNYKQAIIFSLLFIANVAFISWKK